MPPTLAPEHLDLWIGLGLVGWSGLMVGRVKSSWATLGPSWGLLGPSWRPFRGLGAILGLLGAILMPSWGFLGPTWALLGPRGGILRPLGAILGQSWGQLEANLGPKGFGRGVRALTSLKHVFREGLEVGFVC